MLNNFSKKYPRIREKLVKPFLVNIDPNIITFLGFIVALISGYLFFINSILIASVLVLLNGFLDILDGAIAKKFNRITKLGDFLDHSFDRLADIVILAGITFSPLIPDWIGILVIIFVFLVSYLGTQAQALNFKRLYGGLIGRSDRIIIIFLGGILTVFYPPSLYYAMLVLLILSIVTFFQRFFIIYNDISNK